MIQSTQGVFVPKTKKHPFVEKLLKEVKQAIKEFGTYSFDDKGPEEVMNVSPLIREFKSLNLQDKKQVVKNLKKNNRGNSVLICILGDLESNMQEVEFKEILKEASQDVQEWFYPTKEGIEIPLMSAGDFFKELTSKLNKS